jgi:hypothetical protein
MPQIESNEQRSRDAMTLPAAKFRAIGAPAVGLALAASLMLAGCATATNPTASASAPPSGGMRDLTPEEKKAIMAAVGPSLRNPAAAKYHWAKFPTVVMESSVNYCATVDAQSPYAAYSGHQAYVVEARVVGGRVAGAVMGLITGGKDFVLVTQMCEKYGLDPKNAT